MWKRVPRAFRSFYFITGLIFLIWMLFLDTNDLISRVRLSSKLHSLENEKIYYLQKIKEVEQDRDELLGNKELLEKFAREKYLMKKESEDVFVVIEK
jgi:cell division protein FtsB